VTTDYDRLSFPDPCPDAVPAPHYTAKGDVCSFEGIGRSYADYNAPESGAARYVAGFMLQQSCYRNSEHILELTGDA
jgi:hypothetical protein